MPNRFDIFITRLETKNAREAAPPHPIDDQHRLRRRERGGKPSRGREPLTEKDRAKHREKHDA